MLKKPKIIGVINWTTYGTNMLPIGMKGPIQMRKIIAKSFFRFSVTQGRCEKVLCL